MSWNERAKTHDVGQFWWLLCSGMWHVRRHSEWSVPVWNQQFTTKRGQVCSRQRVVSSVKTMMATGWTVRGLNTVGGKFFRTRPDRPRGPFILLYIGYFGSFPWIRRPERGFNHPPYPTPSLNREQSCASTPVFAFMTCYWVTFTFTAVKRSHFCWVTFVLLNREEFLSDKNCC